VVPLVAAKYASECNIIVRNHVPILTHWKLYKEKPAIAFVDLFLGKSTGTHILKSFPQSLGENQFSWINFCIGPILFGRNSLSNLVGYLGLG